MGTCNWARRRALLSFAAAALLLAPAAESMGAAVARASKPARRVPKATGVLHFDYNDFEATLMSPAGNVEVSGKNGRAVLPVGTYSLLSWTLRARGEDGRTWQARGGMAIDDVVIRPGQVTRLTLASPLKAKWVSATGSNPTLMELRFTGTSGEECLGVGVAGKAPPAPRFEVRDAAGAVVYVGAVRFCCKFRGAAVWTRDGTEGTPAGAAGRFTARATVAWGPFSVVMEQPIAFEVAAVTAPAGAATVGQAAPEFSLSPVESGDRVSLSALRHDRPVAVCFFCGCGPCSEVAEGLSRLAGVHAVAVVSDGESFRGEALRRFRSFTGFRGPILFDRDRDATRRYRSFECPRVWLVDRAGRLVYVNENPREAPSRVVAGLRAALDALPAGDAVAAGD
jgi:hypothetical protein